MNRIIVLHQGALGDFILTLPIIQAIREALPAGQVTAIASAASARLAAGRSAVDEHIHPDAVGLHALFIDAPVSGRLAELLDEAALVLSFLSGPCDPLHERLCRHAHTAVISVDPRPTAETIATGRHITDQWAAAVRAQGFTPGPIRPAVIRCTETTVRRETPSEGGRDTHPPGAAAAHELPEYTETATTDRRPRPRALIHPGSGGKAKCWPAERFAGLADALAPEMRVHWMLGPAELETDPERFAPIRHRVEAAGEPLLIEPDPLRAAQRMAGMDLYVGNDAGTTHLAAALGVPTVALFGPTDPRVWRPLGGLVAVVAPEKTGAMERIGIEELFEAVRKKVRMRAEKG